jgi:hypothetical protein
VLSWEAPPRRLDLKKALLLVVWLLGVGLIVVGSLGVVVVETGCSGVCSSEEEESCTSTFTGCIERAAQTANPADCQACADNYCKCFDDCGSTCDRGRVAGRCGT